MKRDFKGIWIPKEIWLDKNLTYFEKAVYAEIDSLCGDDGCFASNKYLMDFFGCSKRYIQKAIGRLKDFGYIESRDLEGNKRILYTKTGVNNISSGVNNISSGGEQYFTQGRTIIHPRNSYNKDYNKDYISSDDDIESSVVVEEKNKRESLKSGVMLSEAQIDSLLELLSTEEFDEYCEKLRAWKQKHPGKTCRSDYKIIMQWAKEDRQTEG